MLPSGMGCRRQRYSVYTPTVTYDFRWIVWNIRKVEQHGLTTADVEHVVENAKRPYPASLGDDKWLVCGATLAGRWIQAIYLIDEDGAIFVIHARPLTADEARIARRHIANRSFK